MKKNSTMRLAVLLLALTLITSCFVGGTFAKYTAGATITGESAAVAKWSFEVGGTDIATSDTATIDLFTTVYEIGTTSADAEVKSGVIAPGTTGKFDLVLENTSEVAAQYNIAFNVTNNDIPLEFKVGDGEWTTTPAVAASNDTILAVGAQAKTITVEWRWAFEQTNVTAGDAADNALGTAAAAGNAAKATVVVTVNAVQVN